ncbi:selenide, water dikinase SelD [Limosilactobacillus reuteri]|uniref:Selenide, water dikinase n=1 Tax=Limosilactobacillus reuteri TaxID=1598 RepID=A0A317GJ39_LIMRT|nr:selenide, water dikinase SelD [Limosilactobacillus reuteri]MCH5384273.1 selenide, water dikinase SelD [Limosilactobacillus reuteri]PWT49009.1 selenide, water dikinase SelD [Limosilactobacillus reuteri]PWT53734.1 selenide, water dikinase SelD [Limosilactobacillus reuteri]PWT64248.1 selenide, water dikinase SelD [Limosilactobacillus reuteri]
MNDDEEFLTVCGGCNAKIGAGNLASILNSLPRPKQSDKLLVGYNSDDDAAVYKINDQTAIIQTIDFFPSMVTDPYLFGQIAATNALSDVFAMGGDVLTCLNVVCFPEDSNMNILEKILAGGATKVKEANGILAGGHSIHDHRVKYGLSVMGTVNPKKILHNDWVKGNDVLILTKPLGVGIIIPAYNAGQASETAYEKAITSMTTLNKAAADIMKKYPIDSCTDITGFGLAGHLTEMLHGKYQAILKAEDIPILPEAYEYAGEFLTTAGGQRNRDFLGDRINFTFNDYALEEILFDPQTSGGLLIAVQPEYVGQMMKELERLPLKSAVIGKVQKRLSNEQPEIVVD